MTHSYRSLRIRLEANRAVQNGTPCVEAYLGTIVPVPHQPNFGAPVVTQRPLIFAIDAITGSPRLVIRCPLSGGPLMTRSGHAPFQKASFGDVNSAAAYNHGWSL